MNRLMWTSTIRLGLLLTAVVVLATALLAGHVSNVSLVVGVFLGASVLGWANTARYRTATHA